MPSRFPPILFAWTLRVLVLAACCASTAHAQETPQQPGLFESLGRLLQPRQEAPAAEASGQVRNLAVAGKERRVALVIGNSAYPGAGALKNPVNDANDIAAKLKKHGFDVTVRTDMRHKEMLRSLTDFGDKVQTGTEALFFYAGHGMQVRGKNYLLPVDAEIRNEASASSEAVDVDQLLDKLALARLSVVILDACRNNPFERRFRGSGQGLAQINAPTGTLIAYATAPGKVAADGDGRNGLYTAELLAAMDVPGIKIEDVFKRVRGNVVRKSNDAQTPWESSSLTGDFYFSFQGPTTANVQQMPADPEAETWAAAEDAKTTEGYQAYLDAYPQGRYAVAAKIKLKGLQKPTTSAAVSPAPTFAPVAVSSTPGDPEGAMWNEVKASGAREYLDAYLKQYPRGKYVALAKVELKKLDERDRAQRAKETSEKQQAAERERQEALRNEQAAWDEAKTGASAAAYANYLERYPKGRYAALAQAALPKLQREAVEQEKRDAIRRETEREDADRRGWQNAVATNTLAAYAHYLEGNPNGKFAELAQKEKQKLQREAADKQRREKEEAALSMPKIEVLEFFSFACSHCNDFHPLISQWAAKLPKDVNFRRVPVTFTRPEWARLSRLFFALEETGDLAKLDTAVFAAVNRDRISFKTDEAVVAWVASKGGDGRKFGDAMASFGLQSKVQRGDQEAVAARIKGVPAIVVDGQLIDNAAASSYEGLLTLTDKAIERARQQNIRGQTTVFSGSK